MGVQRELVTDFGAGEDTVPKTITAVAVANSFARLTNAYFYSGGETDGVTTTGHNDLGCSCLLSDPTTVDLTRYASGVNVDVSVAFEVIEFPASGNDQVIVRMHQDITMNDTDTEVDTAVSGVSVIGDCVPIICGIRNAATGGAGDQAAISAQLLDISGANIRLRRGDGNQECIVSVAVLEFTGSNWAVQQNIPHTQSVIDTIETEACSAVVWAETMIFSSLETTLNGAHDFLGACWPGATTTTVKFQSGSLASTMYAHLVSNSNLVVESIDSFDGSESLLDSDGSAPMIIDKIVSTSVLADHFVVATGAPVSSNSELLRWVWNYYFTTTTNLRWWVTESGTASDMDWAAQLIDISGLSFSQSVTVNLVDIAGVAQASLTGLRWSWFNEGSPGIMNAPSDEGTVETTDAGGELVLDLPNTTLTSGQTGWLALRDPSGLFIGGYRLQVD